MAVTPDMIAKWRREDQPKRDGFYCVDAKDVWPGDVLLGWKYSVAPNNPDGFFSTPFHVDRVTIDMNVTFYGRVMDENTGEMEPDEHVFVAHPKVWMVVEYEGDD